MRRREGELESLGVNVAVVTFEGGPLAEAYARDTGLPWPVLVDAERSLYRAFGMERGRWWDIYGPATLLAYARLLLRGRRPRRSEADLLQLGGDVLVDPEGVVRIHHVGRGPADRPAVEDLLAAVRRARGSDRDPLPPR